MEEELERLCYKANQSPQPGGPVAALEMLSADCLIFDFAFLYSPAPIVSACYQMTDLRRIDSQSHV